jgi:opacity protein-like surface antigen
MKTSCVSFLLLLLATVQISAQVSRELLSFQGVARNATGQVAANTEISLRISIHTFGQPTIFSESHKVHTNPQGNFNIFIGGGQQLVGDYAAIDWKLGQYFLQVEMDPSGGTNYQNMGSTQMVSVPFARQTNGLCVCCRSMEERCTRHPNRVIKSRAAITCPQ